MVEEESKLKQIKQKVQKWKNEGYNVDEIEEKILSAKTERPTIKTLKKESLEIPKKRKIKTKLISLFFVFLVIIAAIYVGISFLGKEHLAVEPEVNNTPSLKTDYVVFSMNSTGNIIDVLLNDEDPDQDILNITQVANPSNGIAEIIDNKIAYTPNANFTGVDTFKYTVSDGENSVSSDVNVVIAGEYPIALMDTSKGMIVLELYSYKAPKTVENFIKLANDGFYDNLMFHRVIDDFMIQGGGYYANGTIKESPYGAIDLEINPDIHHVDGAIAMARTSEPNSATSQFYICDGAQSYLDDQYAVFGVTIEGMDVVRAIASVETTRKYGLQDWPITDIKIHTIKIEDEYLYFIREEP